MIPPHPGKIGRQGAHGLSQHFTMFMLQSQLELQFELLLLLLQLLVLPVLPHWQLLLRLGMCLLPSPWCKAAAG